MKEIVIIFVILATSVALNHLGSPTAWERDAVLWQRKTREEQERITREMLTVRNNINNQLKKIDDGTNGRERDLKALKTRLENENRELLQITKEADKLTSDAWWDAKGRAQSQILQVKREYMRLQKKMERG